MKSSLVNVLVLERISLTFLSFSASLAVGIATTSTNSLGRYSLSTLKYFVSFSLVVTKKLAPAQEA